MNTIEERIKEEWLDCKSECSDNIMETCLLRGDVCLMRKCPGLPAVEQYVLDRTPNTATA